MLSALQFVDQLSRAIIQLTTNQLGDRVLLSSTALCFTMCFSSAYMTVT